MKRKYKETQKRVDISILTAIQDGITGRTELKQVLMDGWQDYNLGELVDCFARTEVSACLQRLKGHIEITKGNIPKPEDQLSPDDIEFIDGRDARQIAGRLKERVLFNNRHGRPEQAQEAASQLSLFNRQETEDQLQKDKNASNRKETLHPETVH